MVGASAGANDKQCAMAQMHGQVARIDGGISASADDLRGTGFTGDQIGQARADTEQVPGPCTVPIMPSRTACRCAGLLVMRTAGFSGTGCHGASKSARMSFTRCGGRSQPLAKPPVACASCNGVTFQKPLTDAGDHRIAGVPFALLGRVFRLPLG